MNLTMKVMRRVKITMTLMRLRMPLMHLYSCLSRMNPYSPKPPSSSMLAPGGPEKVSPYFPPGLPPFSEGAPHNNAPIWVFDANNHTMMCTARRGQGLSNYFVICRIGDWLGTFGMAVL